MQAYSKPDRDGHAGARRAQITHGKTGRFSLKIDRTTMYR
jgi:hypothetical protein